jgi:hypothetical protein
MKKAGLFWAMLCASLSSVSQNDIDAIRYSRPGVNGTSRYVAMGGAFGALGADLSCAAYNPAGLALFRKGEITFGGGLKFTNNSATVEGKSTRLSDAKFVFNNFGISFILPSTTDPESRHVFAFTNMQTQNFYNKSRAQVRTYNSIAKDMLNLAIQRKTLDALDTDYEYMGYYVYAIDYDSTKAKWFSFVDPKRTVLQTRDIVTTGKMNDLNFSYAYAYKDKFYIGASLGIPRISYTSTTTHTESDDKDSMRITNVGPGTYTSTYSEGSAEQVYPDKLGFNSLTYMEYFTTSGSGFNLKLGGVARINDQVRVGIYYHTPSIFKLNDRYYYYMSSTFDFDTKKIEEIKVPEEGGYYQYRVVTPGRLGISTGIVINKFAAIGLDYEYVDYRTAQLSGENVSDFAGVNAVIENKYLSTSNFRAGVEFNLKPVMLRAGYNMQGSPFGNAITGKFVRNTVSVGFGFRSKNNVFYDFAWFKNFSTEDYFMFTTYDQKAVFNFSQSQLAATIGIKF